MGKAIVSLTRISQVAATKALWQAVRMVVPCNPNWSNLLTDPLSFFNLPPFLSHTAPPELCQVASNVLSPLTGDYLQSLNPTMEDMVLILEDMFAYALGMGHSSATQQMADVVARLIAISDLVVIAKCGGENDGDSCNGKHGVSISDKGRAFIAAYKASLGKPQSNLNKKLEDDAQNFLDSWDGVNPDSN